MKLISGRYYGISDNDAPALDDCITASAKNSSANVVVPVVDNSLEHVGISALGYRFKEISANRLRSGRALLPLLDNPVVRRPEAGQTARLWVKDKA